MFHSVPERLTSAAPMRMFPLHSRTAPAHDKNRRKMCLKAPTPQKQELIEKVVTPVQTK